MAYLGNIPARSFISFERQVFTIVNSQTAYTLSHSVTNENDIRLVVNNVVQEPGSGKAYTASGTTLTLSAALTNGTDEMYCVFLGRAVGTVDPPAGSVSTSQLASDAVTEAKIADGAVESEHLNNNVISGQTELAAEPADTDEFLVSDAGTIKRIDYSLIKGGGKILQHVTATSGTGTATTATGFTATSGLPTLDITPSATSSKILLFASFGEVKVNANKGYITIYADSSDLGANNYGFAGTASTTLTPAGGAVHTHSPNTTSQVTYSVRVRGDTGTTVTIGGLRQTLTALELGA
tara:strand:+ start:337 stop:1221 length:885 start_codon:yes stop_codon:yes gene_type:complete